MSASRSLLGVQAIDAAEKRREQLKRESDWPYIHIFPPPNSIPLHAMTQSPVAVGAMAATVTALSYQVPEGLRAYVIGILQAFSGATLNPGDLLWTVTQNKPVGIADIQGAPVQGLASIPVPLGEWQYGVWWPLPRAYVFEPETVLRSTCLNSTGAIVAGVPNVLVSGFFGWLTPESAGR